MIVITMTSWKMRISNVKSVIESVLKNTLLPDRVYLNLSSDEFTNKEDDLPNDLVELFNSNDFLIINWVKENTKTMKKVFPILKYLSDDDIIINIDDDMLLPEFSIEYRVCEFKMKQNPITGANNPRCHMIDRSLMMYCCGPFSIFQKKHLLNWEIFVNDKIINTYNDDYTYTMICWLNGYRFYPCSDYSRHTGISNHKISKYNDVYSSFKLKLYVDRGDMYNVLKDRVKEITNMSVENSFGYYKKMGNV